MYKSEINKPAIVLLSWLIVATILLSAIEVKGQITGYEPLKNVNFFQSQDTTANAKAYNRLTTRAQRDSAITTRVIPDWTNTIDGRPEWNCNQSKLQLTVNSHDWGEGIYLSTGPLYNNNYDSETNLEKLYQSGGTLKDMGKLGLPTYNLSLSDDITLKDGHGQNVILTGDDATKFEDWTIIEPSNDQINIKPGDGRSPFPKNCEHVQIFYNYVININGTKRFNSFLMLEFRSKEGVVELTYNVNKDTKPYPINDEWKPLNQLVHLIEKRSDIPTATRREHKLENAVKVYPNPATDYLNIQWKVNNEPFNIELIDITGKIVFKNKATNDSKISLQNYPSGLYFVRISDKNTVQTKKVWLQ